jgi:hypothetical protein
MRCLRWFQGKGEFFLGAVDGLKTTDLGHVSNSLKLGLFWFTVGCAVGKKNCGGCRRDSGSGVCVSAVESVVRLTLMPNTFSGWVGEAFKTHCLLI